MYSDLYLEPNQSILQIQRIITKQVFRNQSMNSSNNKRKRTNSPITVFDDSPQSQHSQQPILQQHRQIKSYYMIYNRNDKIGTLKNFLGPRFASSAFGVKILKDDNSNNEMNDDERVPKNKTVVVEPTWSNTNEPSDIVDTRLMYNYYIIIYLFKIDLVYQVILIYMKYLNLVYYLQMKNVPFVVITY